MFSGLKIYLDFFEITIAAKLKSCIIYLFIFKFLKFRVKLFFRV